MRSTFERPTLAARRLVAVLGISALVFLLQACGSGTTLLGGVGSGGSGLAEGTVTGLGSIFVDGVEFDDGDAPVQTQDAAGAMLQTVARIGQRVRVAHDGKGSARSVEVLPQLLGPVSQVQGDGWVRVMNQWVRVLDASDGSTLATVLAGSGYASSADVAVGDIVEVHGSWRFADSRSAYALIATRLEKRTDGPQGLLLGGVVGALESGGFRLNSASGTQVLGGAMPAGLNTGSLVSVWIPAAQAGADTVQASRVRLGTPMVDPGTEVTLSGSLDSLDATARLVTVQGITARLPAGWAAGALARGDFVQLSLRRDADGWDALEVRPRSDPMQFGGTVELKGAVAAVQWGATTPTSFKLRGTRVVVTEAALAASDCASAPSSGVVYVEARARPGPEPLVVEQIACAAKAPTGATLEQTGTVVAIDTPARTVEVRTAANELLTLSWNDLTLFGASPQDLLGQRVELETQSRNGKPVLRSMHAQH